MKAPDKYFPVVLFTSGCKYVFAVVTISLKATEQQLPQKNNHTECNKKLLRQAFLSESSYNSITFKDQLF